MWGDFSALGGICVYDITGILGSEHVLLVRNRINQEKTLSKVMMHIEA